MEARLALTIVTTIGLAACHATTPGGPPTPAGARGSAGAARTETPAMPVVAPLTLDSRPTLSAMPAVALQEEEGFSSEFEAASEDEWRFIVAPYVWFMQLDGNSEVDGTVSRIDEDFSDLVDQLNFVAEGRFEAWKGDWGGLVDVTYAKLSNDAEIGPADVDTDTDVLIGFGGLLHNFIERDPDENGVGGLRLDGFFGVAVTSIEADVDISLGPDLHQDKTWVDPIVGMRSRFTFNKNWGGSLQYDVGGFELFDGSELTTMGTALIGRRFSKNRVLYFGWRTLFIDYSQKFEVDLAVNGPIVGFEWGF